MDISTRYTRITNRNGRIFTKHGVYIVRSEGAMEYETSAMVMGDRRVGVLVNLETNADRKI